MPSTVHDYETIFRSILVRPYQPKNLIKNEREKERERGKRDIQTKEREAEEGYTAPFIVLKREKKVERNKKTEWKQTKENTRLRAKRTR